jgi:CRISPR-associated protein Csb2
MLRVTLGFPLGMYHAQSGASSADPEWPPSPLRLLGALLAAAHGRHHTDPAPDRALLQRLSEAPPPQIFAPESVAVGEPADGDVVVRLRGATRWAPRNYVGSALSFRNIGRERAEVSKAGVAIGDRPIHFVWPHLDLSSAELERLSLLAADVTFVGTTRSPVLVDVASTSQDVTDRGLAPWLPFAPGKVAATTAVRVPDERTIADFDVRERARRSETAKVRSTGLIPQVAIGDVVRYTSPTFVPPAEAFDPRWWGDVIVLSLDRDKSQLTPKAPSAYLLARAVRVALLGSFDDAGTPGEAPSILTARGADPHCAIVPLPNVWGRLGSGNVLGVAVVLPHERRLPDLAEQRARLERGLHSLLSGAGADPASERRYVRIPNAGMVQLAAIDAAAASTTTLRETSYCRASRTWVTVTPVVHSRWRKGGSDGLMRQVSIDCAHVGLPVPERVEVLRGAGRRGGADRLVAVRHVPPQWRGPLQGPTDHLRITFPQPVAGPVLLGRARHFGVGLCVPADVPEDSRPELQAA